MANVTPNIASTTVAGVIKKRLAINPTKSVEGQTSTFAGFDPNYTPGQTQKITPSDKYASRNSGNGNKIFINEAQRPGRDGIDQTFYAHIA